MNLVDTSGWLEYFANGSIADIFAPILEQQNKLLVSVINIYEVYKKVAIQKGDDAAYTAMSVMMHAKVIDTNTEICVLAAQLSLQHKLPMADSLILATANINRAILWTQDADFENITGVKYIMKSYK